MVMGGFVGLFACLPIRVSLCFFGWLVVACVFLPLCGTFSCLIRTLGGLFSPFLHFGGPCHSIVTLGVHFAALGDLFLHVFRTCWDLGAQFVDL